MDKTNLNRDELSTLVQAFSKVVVPSRVLDHAQAYELEIGDIVYLDYVSPDEYKIKKLANVIDQLGAVLELPEWKYSWHHGPCKIVAQDGVTRRVSEQIILRPSVSSKI